MSAQLPLLFVRGSKTSESAAVKIDSSAATLRERVFDLLKRSGPLTDEQMQMLLEMNPSTQRPRRVELVDAGRVRDSQTTAKTKSGRSAVLWEIVTK